MPPVSALLHFLFLLLHFVKEVFNQPGFLANQTELFSLVKSNLIKFLSESTLQGKSTPKPEEGK
jgi:hypothetical protein